MKKVLIEVHSGAALFRVAVRAVSVRRAVELVEGRYPSREVRVKFPIDSESFIVQDPAARTGMVEFEQSKKVAA